MHLTAAMTTDGLQLQACTKIELGHLKMLLGEAGDGGTVVLHTLARLDQLLYSLNTLEIC